jgi:hypothetical protein
MRDLRHAVPERAATERAPSTEQALACPALQHFGGGEKNQCAGVELYDGWADHAKFNRRARHAVPLLRPTGILANPCVCSDLQAGTLVLLTPPTRVLSE